MKYEHKMCCASISCWTVIVLLAVFAVGCEEKKKPTHHKVEGYLLKADPPIHILIVDDVDKLEGKWWDTDRKDVKYGHLDVKFNMPVEMMNALQENKYYEFWYFKKDGKKFITSARMPIEINRKLSEKRANYKEEEEKPESLYNLIFGTKDVQEGE